MRINRAFRGRLALALFAGIALVTGCNSGAGFGPTGQTLIQARSRPLSGASTVIGVFDSCCGPIYGSVTNSCGISASPSPLPTIKTGDTKRVTLTVGGACATPPNIAVAYGTGRTGYTCTLTTTYNALTGTFGYSMNNELGVDCFAYPGSPSDNFNEGFFWQPCLSNCLDLRHEQH
jgi:hypothetical protein